MKSSPTIRMALAAVAFTLATIAHAENQSVSDASKFSNRDEKKFGAYLGILGDPHPTVLGINVAYNVNDYLRASAGFGQITVTSGISIDDSGMSTQETTMTTVGTGAKFFVPGWSLSPTAGLAYSHVFMSGDNTDIIDYKSNNFSTSLGFDWQTRGGFNMGGGMNLSLNDAAPTAPYINLGWFF